MKRLFCFLLDHRYYVWQHFSRISRRVICLRCGGDWGMNDEVRAIIPWDGQLAQLYEMQGHRIRELHVGK